MLTSIGPVDASPGTLAMISRFAFAGKGGPATNVSSGASTPWNVTRTSPYGGGGKSPVMATLLHTGPDAGENWSAPALAGPDISSAPNTAVANATPRTRRSCFMARTPLSHAAEFKRRRNQACTTRLG